ncbi:MAG: hypothetical protein RSC05_14400 [Acinetobacter sp.]
MSNCYIYPTNKFKITLDLEVSVDHVSVWKGIGVEVLQQLYDEGVKDGSLIKLIKETIISDLTNGEAFDMTGCEPFDRLCFSLKETKGDI